EGVDALRGALGRSAALTPSRAADPRSPVLHVDRAFTIHGAGSIVTGTLWSGTLQVGEQLTILPAGARARIRGLQVHNDAVEQADAGQRVAINLAGVPLADLERGMALAGFDAGLEPAWILDASLSLADPKPPRRVHVHHGTRETPARLVELGGTHFQLRCDKPLFARYGDRLVIRAIAPPNTLGGGTVIDPHARRYGPGRWVQARLEKLERAESGPRRGPANTPGLSPKLPVGETQEDAAGHRTKEVAASLQPAALALERRLLAAAHEPPLDADLGTDAEHLSVLRAAGRAVRLGPAMHAHPDALAAVHQRVTEIVEAEGSVTVARLRDDLGSSRKYAQALLEHCDTARLTLRLPDNRRVLRGARQAEASATPESREVCP
ncbi:MAG TPA: SelB C-terminal domain-containing protein, partial [Thermoleophilaceae bacterium]